ncbi:hypothetical protein HWV62_2145 [Athelia sp. TMB]|nr:hypothetical protein HWV62_2145 [Athelia sp. TMB]
MSIGADAAPSGSRGSRSRQTLNRQPRDRSRSDSRVLPPTFNTHDTSGGTVINAIGDVYYERSQSPNGPPVFWLSGSAGTGKSTIAVTVAETFKKMGMLGASFFCSRDDATCSNHKFIFPSIAYQFAQLHTHLGHDLADIVKKRLEIAHADVAYQLQELIIDPLSKRPRLTSHYVVVIDALDECKDDSTTSVILAAFSRYVEKLSPLKIFLTSRPEHNINLGFEQGELQAATRRLGLHEIELPVVEADINTYLAHQLEVVRMHYKIGGLWPSAAQLNLLSKLSCGLFIFAATSIKFIQDRHHDDPRGQLEKILSNAHPIEEGLSNPRHRLDQLYLQVLTNSHSDISSALAERLRIIFGTIVLLQDPLSPQSIQHLLNGTLRNMFETHPIRQTLIRLHSIIIVPANDGDIIRALHPSFFDFIVHPSRCSSSKFLVDPRAQHSTLVAACLDTMRALKRNICELPDTGILNQEVNDFSARISRFLPPELQYACRHWGTHLKHALLSDEILSLLDFFCSEYLLFWVEVCSLLGDLRNQLILLDDVQKVLAVSVWPSVAFGNTELGL